jgi:hypothetical protein
MQEAQKKTLRSIRLFEDTLGLCVALYGEPSALADGWIENLPASDVFNMPPKGAPLEVLIQIEDITSQASFQVDFLDRYCINHEIIERQMGSTSRQRAGSKCDKECSTLLFFPHIPKAGGQTLTGALSSAFGAEKRLLIADPRFGGDLLPEDFCKLIPERLDNISVISGHLPMAKFISNIYVGNLLKQGKVRIFTSVRNPIDRIISLYNYIRLAVFHPLHKHVSAMPLDTFASQQPANFQYHFLSAYADDKPEDIFDYMDIFPLEYSRRGLQLLLESHYSITIPEITIQNSSTDLAEKRGITLFKSNDLRPELLRKLKDAHWIDYKIYELAKDRQLIT